MLRINVFDEETPISVYNADKKEIIGIFKNRSILVKYLYPNLDSKKRIDRITQYLRGITKSLLKTNQECKVVIRISNDIQINTLSEQDFIIMPGYPSFNNNRSFVSTRASHVKEDRDKRKG